ncbi:MAG: hypothetical protein IPH75_13920 [bacterium]|nr:hypothetical protein [bacterium]
MDQEIGYISLLAHSPSNFWGEDMRMTFSLLCLLLAFTSIANADDNLLCPTPVFAECPDTLTANCGDTIRYQFQLLDQREPVPDCWLSSEVSIQSLVNLHASPFRSCTITVDESRLEPISLLPIAAIPRIVNSYWYLAHVLLRRSSANVLEWRNHSVEAFRPICSLAYPIFTADRSGQ